MKGRDPKGERLFLMRHVACGGLLVLLSRKSGGAAFLEDVDSGEGQVLDFGGTVVCSRCRRGFHLVLLEESEANETLKMPNAAAGLLQEEDELERYIEEMLSFQPAEIEGLR